MSDSTPENQADAVKQALFAGNKIQAIKIYREHAKVGLAEAKTAVEKLESELRVAEPDSFTQAKGKGCFAVLLVSGVIVGAGFFCALC